ncbi:MAG: multiheme c-type cytochrome, partial [Candidatus Binatia bacterium]
IDVTAPSGSPYLDGGTRDSVMMDADTVTADDIILSARPPETATYVGRTTCAVCHPDQAAEHVTSAHWRSLTPDTSRMIALEKWPAVGDTIDTGVTAQNPADPNGAKVEVYWCQNTAGAYAMKFGGTADCTAGDGTVVPVSGTYGGEGDGGIDNVPNVGVFKQRFFAKLADVPAADSWDYTAGKDKDYLILPVQITQSGDDAPSYHAYHASNWATRERTFSRKCAGCHNTGMEIAWNNDTDGFITSYNYIDFNIGCERCHGPGSAHANSGGGLANQIINPEYLAPAAERQVCGQCHAADDGHSAQPATFGYAWNADHAGDVGGGVYVPGVYDIADFIGNLSSGGFHAWPDGKHGRAHRQQYSELVQSAHVNNMWERLTCASCHASHSLQKGPDDVEKESADSQFVFSGTMQLRNNEICLSCHASYGPFSALTMDDVAALHVEGGGTVVKNGADLTLTADEIAASEAAIGDAVVEHMNEEANMGLFVLYDPSLNRGWAAARTATCPRPARAAGTPRGSTPRATVRSSKVTNPPTASISSRHRSARRWSRAPEAWTPTSCQTPAASVTRAIATAQTRHQPASRAQGEGNRTAVPLPVHPPRSPRRSASALPRTTCNSETGKMRGKEATTRRLRPAAGPTGPACGVDATPCLIHNPAPGGRRHADRADYAEAERYDGGGHHAAVVQGRG